MSAASPSPPVGRRPRYRFGNFTLDLDSGFLSRNGEEIKLRPKSFEVLAYLVERHGKLVTKNELVHAVWRNVVVTDNSLAQCLVEIRRALDDEEQRIIRTVARRGYVFAAPVAEWPAPGELPRTAAERAGRSRAVRGLALAGAAAAVAVAGWAVQRTLSGPPTFELRQLTDLSGSALAPALSPDGGMVAFIRGEDHFLSPGNQIWVKLLPNGEPIPLTNDPRLKFAPAFSPDGAYVTYSALESGWNTYRVSSLGGEPQLFMQNASGLTWLSDGRLLFSAQRGNIHMGIVAATPTRADEHEVYWPAHQRGMAHFSYPSRDGRWALVIEMDHHPNWLPCRLVPIDGSSSGREVGPAGACTAAGWSPDGAWMYFTVEVAGQGQLWRQRFPNGKPEQLTFGPAEAQGVAVDPDGRSLITSIGLRRNELWVRDAHGERLLSTQGTVAWWLSLSRLGWAAVPSFSRDGRYLYYQYRPEPSASGFTLWRTELATGRSEAVTEVPVSEYDISPDGAEVVFSTERADGTVEIWRASTNKTSAPRRIAAGDVATPQFGTDGRVLFRESEGTVNRFRWISADGSAHGYAAPFPIATLQTVSPNGRSAVAILQDGGSYLFSIDDGGTQVPLCGGSGCYAQWAPDGGWLYVTPAGSKQTVAIPVKHGASAPQMPAGGIRRAEDHALIPGAVVLDREFVSPGPDPSTYAYVKTSMQRNLYRVQLD